MAQKKAAVANIAFKKIAAAIAGIANIRARSLILLIGTTKRKKVEKMPSKGTRPRMPPKDARRILQKILDDRKYIESKSDSVLSAFDMGTVALSRLNARGASFRHEYMIMSYHAAHGSANLHQDEHTRNAIEQAIKALDAMEEYDIEED